MKILNTLKIELMLKQRIYKLLIKGSHGSKINSIFDYFIMGLIILNVIAIILETMSQLDNLNRFFKVFEIISVFIFSLEYLLRIYISDLTHPAKTKLNSRIKFIFSFYGLIDLFAIAPFYLPFLIKIDLRFLRILRLLRFFRLLKFNRYNNSLNLIWSVFQEKKAELAITGFISVLILIISSFLMYYVEGDVQPEKFPNILASLWWAIATLTTVGYGDVYPITSLGKIISSLIAIIGIGIIALPTGIISAGFLEKIGNKRTNKTDICPHCGKNIE